MFTNTEMYDHAKYELDLLLEKERENNKNRSIEDLDNEVSWFNGKTAQEFMNDVILNIIASIDPSISSVLSLDYLLNTVYDLVKFRNLTPLTLNDNEWVHVSDDSDRGKIYQNKRNFDVFKDDKNGVFHSDGSDSLSIALGKDPETGKYLEDLVIDSSERGENNEEVS